jgi:nucleotide-binding universal stress UspA family protein
VPSRASTHGEQARAVLAGIDSARTTRDPNQPGRTKDMKNSNRPIVVGIDGSRFGHEALRWALAEAERRDCPVRSLLVADTAPVLAAGRPAMVGLGTALPGVPTQDHTRLLEHILNEVLNGQDNPRLTAEVVRGAVAEALCTASKDAQLLVIGSHGHGHAFDAVLGTVAQYCVRHASCPVVVIPRALADPDELSAPVVEPRRQGDDLAHTPAPLL